MNSNNGHDIGRVDQLAATVELLVAGHQRHEANFAELKDMISRAMPSQSPNQRDEQSTLAQKQKKGKGVLISDPPTQLQRKGSQKESNAPKMKVRSRSAQLTIPEHSSQEEDEQDDDESSSEEDEQVDDSAARRQRRHADLQASTSKHGKTSKSRPSQQ